MRLQGKVAFITGAGLGIGRAAAALFAREGARVVIAEFNEESGRAAADAIRSLGGDALFVHTDVSEADSVKAAIHTTVAQFGRLDILYNNVGGTKPGDGPLTEVADEIFWRTVKVDFYGVWLCCKHAIPELRKAGGGAIVNTASMVALSGYPDRDAYTGSKGAVVALTRSLAVEYAPDAIRVNAVAPGMTLTERGAKFVAEGNMPPIMRERHRLGPLEPADVAQAALFLASDDARRITGQILSVDSGYVAT